MTKDTPPTVEVSWEPITEGIRLYVGDSRYEHTQQSYDMPLTSVRELMYDMEEAVMLSRGYEKVADIEVYDVPDTWIVRVMGNDFRIASTFVEAHHGRGGAWYCLQDNEGRELVWPAEDLVTAYRPVE